MHIYYTKNHIPYFYIIQEISTGMYYAGAKWAQGCRPDELMVEGGYFTSSPTIKLLIDKNGLNSFVIRRIWQFETPKEAYDYETKFLKRINARKNPLFYNRHNNDGLISPEMMEITMLEKYGVTNAAYSPIIRKRIIDTNIERYGVDNPAKNFNIQQKTRTTNLKRYGFDNPLKNPETHKRAKITKQEKYSDPNYNNRANAELTCYKKYGVYHNSQIEEVKSSKSLMMKEKSKNKNNRDNVKLLRGMANEMGVKLGSGWNRRSDEWIEVKILEMQTLHNAYHFA